MNIGTLPARHARYRPNHLALVTESERITFAAFERRIGRLARRFRRWARAGATRLPR